MIAIIAERLGYINMVLVYAASLYMCYKLWVAHNITSLGWKKLFISTIAVILCLVWGVIGGMKTFIPPIVGVVSILVIWAYKVNKKYI
jgi:cell division protein FtsW (lipid II flippase)